MIPDTNWWLITTIPRNKKDREDLTVEGKRIGLVPAKNVKEAANRFRKFNKRVPMNIRIFPCILVGEMNQ